MFYFNRPKTEEYMGADAGGWRMVFGGGIVNK